MRISKLPASQQLVGTVTPAFDQPALPLQIVCCLLGVWASAAPYGTSPTCLNPVPSHTRHAATNPPERAQVVCVADRVVLWSISGPSKLRTTPLQPLGSPKYGTHCHVRVCYSLASSAAVYASHHTLPSSRNALRKTCLGLQQCNPWQPDNMALCNCATWKERFYLHTRAPVPAVPAYCLPSQLSLHALQQRPASPIFNRQHDPRQPVQPLASPTPAGPAGRRIHLYRLLRFGLGSSISCSGNRSNGTRT